MQFREAWNELLSSVPKLDALNAQKLVNRAWRDIQDARRWTFLKKETIITTPAELSTSGATVTQGSVTVALSAAAATLVDALPTTGSNAITNRQFRIGQGPIYNISAYANPNITLEHQYGEADGAGVTFSIQQLYYDAPSDFLGWDSVIDPVSGFALRLDYTKEELDKRDPQRSSTGQSYVVSSYRHEDATATTAERWRYELWPIPDVIRQYNALYQRRSSDFASATTAQSAIVSDDTLMARARWRAYEWAESNSGRHSELRGVNWERLSIRANNDYVLGLEEARRRDEELFLQTWHDSYLYPPPLSQGFGANWHQSHAPYWPL